MSDPGLEKLLHRLSNNLVQDKLVQEVTNGIRYKLKVDRVALYYFYSHWDGRVTFESLSSPTYSIFGSTGPDECFNQEYADLYQNGRVSAIANIETANIAECHRDFLKEIQVKANLVVPVLSASELWGLLVAHHCQAAVEWSTENIQTIKDGAKILASAKTIRHQKRSLDLE